MIVKSVVVQNLFQSGTNLAPLLVQLACRFQSQLYLSGKEQKINLKSLLGVMALNLSPGMTVNILAEGTDEQEALATLEKFFAGNNK